jgi:NADPH-dependent F420 reductase
MRTKQTIAIIGASGTMGSAIAKSLCKGNYKLLLCSNEPGKIETLINDIKSTNSLADVEISDCFKEACWEADIIIAAVPYASEQELAERIKEVANQKIVISIANPLNETYTGLITAADTSAAEELQKLLPHSKVIKAFNTTFAADFSTAVIDRKKIDAFIAGNDEDALETVSELVSTAGFNPVIAGVLSASRTLENTQLMLIQSTRKYNYNWLAAG